MRTEIANDLIGAFDGEAAAQMSDAMEKALRIIERARADIYADDGDTSEIDRDHLDFVRMARGLWLLKDRLGY